MLGARLRVVAVPVLATLAYLVVDRLDSGDSLLATLDSSVRDPLFVSAAATTGVLLGSAIAGITVLLAVGQGPRMSWLKSKALFRREARFVLFSAIVGLAGSTVAFLVLVAVAADERLPLSWGLVAAAAAALSVDRFWRLISFLDALLRVALADGDPNVGHLPFSEPMEAD